MRFRQSDVTPAVSGDFGKDMHTRAGELERVREAGK